MKASVPNWLKEELLKKKSTVAGGGQVSTVEDDIRANGDDLGASVHNKLEFSERSRSDLSRQSDTEDEDEEVSFLNLLGWLGVLPLPGRLQEWTSPLDVKM